MTISDKDFPSSKAFDVLEQILQDEETRKDMMKSAKPCFVFDLTSNEGKQVLTGRVRAWSVCNKRLIWNRKVGRSI
jgi:hypothetical protein